MSAPIFFRLPNLLGICPFVEGTNPYYKQVGAESLAWLDSYNAISPRKRAVILKGCNELLVAYTYPNVGYQELRIACDLVHLLFVLDEVSDDMDAVDARATGKVFIDALCDPHCRNTSKLARMTKDFRGRFLRVAGKCAAVGRVFQTCREYIDAVGREAEYRDCGLVLGVEAYTALRRENSAIRVTYALLEALLHVNLPKYVFKDPTFMQAYWAAVDMVSWSNDAYSYNREQSQGQTGNNIVTVLMKENGTGLQETMDYTGEYFQELVDNFLDAADAMPSWGEKVDDAVARYMEGLEYWVSGNLNWSLDTQRYFGKEHKEVKKTLYLMLKPRETDAN